MINVASCLGLWFAPFRFLFSYIGYFYNHLTGEEFNNTDSFVASDTVFTVLLVIILWKLINIYYIIV